MRTNILLLTADDMEGTTPGAFGGPAGVTPALDRLAAEGMTFGRAHVPVAVCQPSRSAIMTGLWPHRNGAEGFEPIDDGVPLLTELLARADYRTGILGKVNHLQPVARFGWDTAVDMRALGLGRDPVRYAEETAAFLGAGDERPWFLMVNAHDPHRPFHGSEDLARMFGEDVAGVPDPSRVFTADDERATPPGYLPDIPPVREEYAQYLSSARRCDDVVRAVLAVLEEAGLAESTLVVFLSDNGMAFPFAKANCYLQSTRTPLIVRWPGVTSPGTAEPERFVSMLDLFPTFCEAAGVAAGDIDGESLVPVLRGSPSPAAEHIVTVFHETAAQARYEMRCVQDADHGYIWNGWADGEVEYRAENMAGLSWAGMVAAGADDPAIAARVEFYTRRRTEELYDLRADPSCLRDLAGDPSRAEVLATQRNRLRSWMVQTGDPLLTTYDEQISARAITPEEAR